MPNLRIILMMEVRTQALMCAFRAVDGAKILRVNPIDGCRQALVGPLESWSD